MRPEIEDFKALIFKVGNEEYGVHIQQVVSIEKMEPITGYPNRPQHVLGITTVRNVVTPVIDLGGALTGNTLQHKDSTRLIIVQASEREVGLVVDAATDVLDIPGVTIQQPNLIETKKAPYLIGISKMDKRIIILLDIDKLLEDITQLEKLKELELTL